MKIFSAVLLAACLFSAPELRADDLAQAASDIPEFHPVSDGIFRGGHPGDAGLADLVKLGVKTVIDLENDSDVSKELTSGQALGMQMISQPMSKFWAPSDKQADEILRLLTDPSLRPVFIHCTLGQDRTGLMVALYRVLDEKMDSGDAYKEMLGFGFKNNLLFPLDDYYRARTGYRGEIEQ